MGIAVWMIVWATASGIYGLALFIALLVFAHKGKGAQSDMGIFRQRIRYWLIVSLGMHMVGIIYFTVS